MVPVPGGLPDHVSRRGHGAWSTTNRLPCPGSWAEPVQLAVAGQDKPVGASRRGDDLPLEAAALQVGARPRVLLIEPSARRLDPLARLVRQSLESASGLR